MHPQKLKLMGGRGSSIDKTQPTLVINWCDEIFNFFSSHDRQAHWIVYINELVQCELSQTLACFHATWMTYTSQSFKLLRGKGNST